MPTTVTVPKLVSTSNVFPLATLQNASPFNSKDRWLFQFHFLYLISDPEFNTISESSGKVKVVFCAFSAYSVKETSDFTTKVKPKKTIKSAAICNHFDWYNGITFGVAFFESTTFCNIKSSSKTGVFN